MKPSWLTYEDIINIHDNSLHHFGGGDGIRDRGLLQSAIARPQQLLHNEQPSLFDLAACYTYGIIKNHPFIDGNTRTGFMALAASQITEKDYANWLSKSCEDV